MDVKYCRGCGKIFNYITGPQLCMNCKQKLESKFQQLKEFIRENPGVTVMEASEACDVEPGLIKQWLREERLQLDSKSPLMLNCENCGQPILSGRFCDRCKAGLLSDFETVIKKPATAPVTQEKAHRDNGKMRYLK